ncbi:protein Wnt-9a-like isoform X2 [Panulirus ornatus]
MRYERWNCSLGKTRRKIMRRVFRETAFLQALSSASVTHVVSRACAQGRLTHCSCGYVSSDEDGDGEDHLRAWRWGGCGDNIRHGSRFAAKIFIGGRQAKAKRKASSGGHPERKFRPVLGPPRGQDFKSRIDIHNARVGIITVEKTAKETCKCHGVSGSCSTKTCWIQLPSFAAAAMVIKQLYETASLAVTNNEARMGRMRMTKKKRKQRFPRAADYSGSIKYIRSLPGNYRNLTPAVYVREGWMGTAKSQTQEDYWRKKSRKRFARDLLKRMRRQSPKSLKRRKNSRRLSGRRRPRKSYLGDPTQLVYLDNSPNFCRKGKYGPGTGNRSCKKSNCESLCCGRGYDTSVVVLQEPCRCRVVWCCRVHCHNCSRTAEIYTCK